MDRALFLLRHAKSSWDDHALDDFDRPLAPRGLRDAPAIGREMARHGWIPDRALVSPALRAAQTWNIAAKELPTGIEVVSAPDLYEAEAEDILRVIRATPERCGALLVVGHNPGLERLVAILSDGERSDAAALAAIGRKFPTCGLVRLETAEAWSTLGEAGARPTHVVRPRDLD